MSIAGLLVSFAWQETSPVATNAKSSKKASIRNLSAKAAKPRNTQKRRVLVEFSASLLTRADDAARKLEQNRSQLIRNAVEQLLNGMESSRFDRELAAAYKANADMNLSLSEEFSAVDREGL
jgi:hypothetical protein